jgi:hypothetical protein
MKNKNSLNSHSQKPHNYHTFANNNLLDGESFPNRCSVVEHASMNV